MTVLEELKDRRETLWLNPDMESAVPGFKLDGCGFVHMKAAQRRLMRFMPYIAAAFPETSGKLGVIESELLPVPKLQAALTADGTGPGGTLWLKDDAHLPIAGSVKARGGIHEVLKIAETLAQKAELLWPTDDYSKLHSEEFRKFFGRYTIQVGSTGNLGLSIGRMSARLGFRAIVHMSADAKQWKKDLLRSEGVTVIEYAGDYGKAVAEGRALSAADEKSYFIDDENSEDLFFGYATAALRLAVQLKKADIRVDAEHPLFVYLPCGVGGAPGGITFGLKQKFGDHVHCFFAEPVEAPCFLLGMATKKQGGICVQDIGLTGQTIADGLAVGRASGFTCRLMEPLVSGAYSVADERLTAYQKLVFETEGIRIEPSACAGLFGAELLLRGTHHACASDRAAAVDRGRAELSASWDAYVEARGLRPYMQNATHIVWATGGGLMPAEEFPF